MDELKQFMSMLPGVLSGIQGDGMRSAAFLEGFNERKQFHEQRRRQKQLDTLALAGC